MTLMLDKNLPLEPEATITTAGEASNIEICIQCDEPFELGEESETCQHHPC